MGMTGDLASQLAAEAERLRLAQTVAEVMSDFGRHSSRQSTATTESGLRIGVAAQSGRGGPSVRMTSELTLCRAALLYADHVTLSSPVASMVADIDGVKHLTKRQRRELILRLLPEMRPDTGPAMVQAVRGLEQRRDKEAVRARMQFDAHLRTVWSELEAKILEIAEGSGLGELRVAMDAGLLELDPLFGPGEDYDADTMVERLVQRLAELLRGADAFPLFDDGVGDLVRSGLQEGLFVVTPSQDRRARNAGLAQGFIDLLPSFPKATVAQVIDIRDELRVPLVRFRQTIGTLSREVDVQAYSEEFGREVLDLWGERVEPALMEIEERVQENTYLRELAGQLDVPGMATSGVAVAMSSFADLPQVVSIAVGASVGLINAERARRAERSAIEKSQFYFLYQGERDLPHN